MAKPKAERWWQFVKAEKPPDSLPTPECFTDEEWGAYYSAETQAVWNKRSLEPSIKRDMCEDCTLPYQISQLKAGKCQPDPSAITPLYRLATILGGERDPIEERQRRSRAAPWGGEDVE
jgi:hypothetical protein